MLHDDLEGWNGLGGWGEVRERGDICIFMAVCICILIVVWKKPTQYCKALILQLKIN